MKSIFWVLLLEVLLLNCFNSFGQNSWFTLRGSDLVKGLDNKDNLRGLLLENHFKLTQKEKFHNTIAGYYEYWRWSSLLEVDITLIPGKENQIEIRIHKDLTDIPERFMVDIKKLFLIKTIENLDDRKATIDNSLIYIDKRSILRYSRITDNYEVWIRFDYPYYHFNFREKFSE